MVGKQIDYAPNRGDDGSLLFTVGIQANGFGLDWCRQLTAGKHTDTAATNGASIDPVASAAFGFQAYLPVFSITGTSMTVTPHEPADNVPFAAISSGAFAAVPGPPAEWRQQTEQRRGSKKRVR